MPPIDVLGRRQSRRRRRPLRRDASQVSADGGGHAATCSTGWPKRFGQRGTAASPAPELPGCTWSRRRPVPGGSSELGDGSVGCLRRDRRPPRRRARLRTAPSSSTATASAAPSSTLHAGRHSRPQSVLIWSLRPASGSRHGIFGILAAKQPAIDAIEQRRQLPLVGRVDHEHAAARHPAETARSSR